MSKPVGYVVRPWGEGYWRWSCTGRGRSGDHWGIVGPPFKRADAERMALEHLAEAHANPGPALQADTEEQGMEVYPESHDRPAARRAVAGPFLRHVRHAVERRRGRDEPGR